MRYFLLGLVLLCVLVASVAGLRGGKSQRPPLEIFPDMDRQPKLRPQTFNEFFSDQLSSRLPVAGTIARDTPYEESALNSGRIPGLTNFVEAIPLAVTRSLLLRGQQRYNINCAPCHGPDGDGKGVISKYGMVGMANFHDARFVKMTDGEIFNTITYGKNLMGAYGANVTITDRWAIIAYVRALQRSQLATLEDVPPPMRSILKK